MSTIVEFEVPSVFTFCRRVGHDGRMEVLRDLTAANCSNRKIGKYKTVDFHNNNVFFCSVCDLYLFQEPRRNYTLVGYVPKQW